MTESQLQGVRDTGNKTDREDYEHFLNNEAAHFSILKDFYESVGSPSAAISVQKMCHLVQIDDWAGVFSFSFTFTPAYDENV